MAVSCHVDFHDKGREEDMHTETVHSNKSTSSLSLVHPKAVKGVVKVWYMKTSAYENLPAIEGDDSCAVAEDGCE